MAIIKNEGKYIKEWIEYYKLIGVTKFYIYDNESNDNTYNILYDYIQSDLVDYTYLPGKARQMDAYNLALNKSKKECKYLLIVDADEFLYSKNGKNIISILNKKINGRVGGVVINWMIFGSSHYKNAPQGLVTSNYVYRSKDMFEKNKLVKTVCDPRKVAGILNPHFVIYVPGYYAIDMAGNKVDGAETKKPYVSELRINHYFTKSKQEFLQKRARGMADQNKIRNLSDFKEHDRNDVYDNGMLKFKKKLEKNIKRNKSEDYN